MDTPAAAPTAITSTDKTLAIVCHISLLIGGIGFLLLPFVIFLVKRGDSPFVAFHAKEALNFHLSLLLYCVCMLPFFFVLMCLIVFIWIPFAIAMGLFALICAIMASVRASEGAYFLYPLTIRFV
jgi:uncharacterized Tic20 family protein